MEFICYLWLQVFVLHLHNKELVKPQKRKAERLYPTLNWVAYAAIKKSLTNETSTQPSETSGASNVSKVVGPISHIKSSWQTETCNRGSILVGAKVPPPSAWGTSQATGF